MQLSPRRKRLYIIGGIILVVLIAIGSIYTAFKNQPSTTVTVNIIVVPSDSKLFIDGQETKPGNHTFTKAEHTLKATRQYFEYAVRTLDFKNVDATQPLYLTPEPKTDQAKQYFLDHPDEERLRELGVGAAVGAQQDYLMKTYPVLAYLPYESTDFKVDYDIGTDKLPIFHVTLYVPYDTGDNHDNVEQAKIDTKQEALDWLTGNGVDVTKANITYDIY